MSQTFSVFRGSESGKIVTDQVTRDMLPQDALVEITHASICGSDKFYLHSPQALGHESVGIVKAIGSDVQNIRVGDRVGLGYVQKTCGACKDCNNGWDQYCKKKELYGQSDKDRGGLGSAAIWNAKALIRLPDNLRSIDAPPLLCAGATAWSVLTKYGITREDRVGIHGIGGLGHLAIKLAAALGFQVIALSGDHSKQEDCLQYGAKEFYGTDGDEMKGMEPLDHLLLCGSGTNDYQRILPLMATRGTIYPLTVAISPVPIPMMPMIYNGITIQGSMTASSTDISEMLQFCTDKCVQPTMEVYSLSSEKGVQEAFTALNERSIRYKAVLAANM